MQKKDVCFLPVVDFKEQTPEILLKEESWSRFMRRHFSRGRIRAKQNTL